MPFTHKGIEYYIGNISTKFTISIPKFKNCFKEIEVKRVETAHLKAQTIIEDEIRRISKKKSNTI